MREWHRKSCSQFLVIEYVTGEKRVTLRSREFIWEELQQLIFARGAIAFAPLPGAC